MANVYRGILIVVVILSVIHILMGTVSMCVGAVSSIQAVVWMAHRVSPIWSGAFFIFTGILGIACVKRQTSYIILCFTAFSMVSLVTAVVAIQLLRLGLVNHTTDGKTYRKERLDGLLLVALAGTSFECLICLISAFVSCRLAKLAKLELYKKREGMFHVEIYGEKDVVVVTRNKQDHTTGLAGCCTLQESDEEEEDSNERQESRIGRQGALGGSGSSRRQLTPCGHQRGGAAKPGGLLMAMQKTGGGGAGAPGASPKATSSQV